MSPSPETRFSLIEKIRNPTDARAWSEFVAIYEPLIVETCRRKGLQHADSIDVAQEVLTRVANSVAGFRYDKPNATFRGWLYRITRNLTIDFLRRRAKDPLAKSTSPTELHRLPHPSREESREFEQSFQRRMFLVVASQVESTVKPQTWLAFWKVEVEQRDAALVAKELGMTRGAVYVAKCRVLAKLRREVQKRLDDTSQHFVETPNQGAVQ